jgi:phosphatidylglycerophosphate synthase
MTLVLLVEQAGDPPGGVVGVTAQLQRLAVRGGLQAERCGDIRQPAAARLAILSDRLDRCAADNSSVGVVTPALSVPDEALLRMLDDPSLVIGALVASPHPDRDVATQGSTVLAASTSRHPVTDADAGFLGAIYLDRAVLPIVASAVRQAAADSCAAWDGLDLLDLLLTILVRSAPSGVPPVTAVRLEQAAGRPDDGFYSTFVLRRISRRLTPWTVRHGISANTVTAVSTVIGIGGAATFAIGSYPALLVGALLLQFSLVLDCVDGEIARSTRTCSTFGSWLDAVTDRVKEYAALAGLALAGAHRGQDLWTLATACMIAQTVRHMQTFAFDKGVLAERRVSFRDSRPLTDLAPWRRPLDATVSVPGIGTPGQWLRRIIHMPIGERWLVLSVGAGVGSPAAGLVAYLVLAVLAEAWTLLGAIRRTAAGVGRNSRQMRQRLAELRDDGPLDVLTRRRSPDGIGGWALPPLVTALEGAAVLTAAAVDAKHWTAAVFGWFAVVAWHRYDLVYRGGGPLPRVPRGIGWLGGGWLLRTAAVIAVAAAGVLPAGLVAGICWLGLVYVPESLLRGIHTLGETRRWSP